MISTNEFIQLARSIHGDKYSYENTVFAGYGKNKTIIITCPIHGKFEQTSTRHIHDKRGCFQCGRKIPTLVQFKQNCDLIHNNKFDYTKTTFNRLSDKITIGCPVHGDLAIKASDHWNGVGCSRCAGNYRPTTNDFVEQAIGVHSDKYKYSNVKYVSAHMKISITCLVHGDFMQTPNSHLNGNGCKTCYYDRLRTEALGSYNTRFLELYPEKTTNNAILYVVDMKSENEHFIKVGITTRTVKIRFESMGRKYTVGSVFELDTTLAAAIEIEQQIKYKYNDYRYLPIKEFDGKTECFIYTSNITSDIINEARSINNSFIGCTII